MKTGKLKLLTVLYQPEWGWGWRSGLVRIFFLKDEAVLWACKRHADWRGGFFFGVGGRKEGGI